MKGGFLERMPFWQLKRWEEFLILEPIPVYTSKSGSTKRVDPNVTAETQFRQMVGSLGGKPYSKVEN